jgi:hypothetical protein
VFDALMEALEEERLLHERLLEVLLKCGFEAPKYSVKRETKA